MNTKHIVCDIVKSADDRFDATFALSAADKDRVGDTIDPVAYEKYEGKSLIALWQHRHDQPVGSWVNLRAKGARLLGDIKFAGTQMARMAKQLLDDDVPLGASIGFLGKGEPNKYGGFHFADIELLECSIVSVPANPRAVRIAKSLGLDPAAVWDMQALRKQAEYRKETLWLAREALGDRVALARKAALEALRK
jgi:HK97 family phage prohead protease